MSELHSSQNEHNHHLQMHKSDTDAFQSIPNRIIRPTILFLLVLILIVQTSQKSGRNDHIQGYTDNEQSTENSRIQGKRNANVRTMEKEAC